MSKFIITGGAGNVSKPLTEILLSKGHDVTVVGRNPDNLVDLVNLGAGTAIGNLADAAFLTETFKGADGIYLMPSAPSWDKPDLKKLGTDLGQVFFTAIRAANIKNVVFLSSYGAHRLHDAGAISGMGLTEVELNKLDGVNVLHLRAGYFYTNLLLSLGQIKEHGVMGNMFDIPAGTFTVVDPQDIAETAANALINQDFKGHSFRYVVSDETGTAPQHEEGIRASIAAGKDVYSEWPFTTSTQKAEELLALTKAADIRHVIGLHRRLSPTNRYIADLIKQGYVGKLRSVRLHVSMNYLQAVRSKIIKMDSTYRRFLSYHCYLCWSLP